MLVVAICATIGHMTSPDTKTKMARARVTPDEMARIAVAAYEDARSISGWLRLAVLEKLERDKRAKS